MILSKMNHSTRRFTRILLQFSLPSSHVGYLNKQACGVNVNWGLNFNVFHYTLIGTNITELFLSNNLEIFLPIPPMCVSSSAT